MVVKFVQGCPFADPEVAARKLMELAHAFKPVQDGCIYVEKINGPFLFKLKGAPAEYKSGLNLCVAREWLLMSAVREGSPLALAAVDCATSAILRVFHILPLRQVGDRGIGIVAELLQGLAGQAKHRNCSCNRHGHLSGLSPRTFLCVSD